MAVPLHPCNHGIGTSMCSRRPISTYAIHGCIDGIFRKIYPMAVTISYVLNSYKKILKIQCCPCVPWLKISEWG
jgi:hypothetical protein